MRVYSNEPKEKPYMEVEVGSKGPMSNGQLLSEWDNAPFGAVRVKKLGKRTWELTAFGHGNLFSVRKVYKGQKYQVGPRFTREV